MKRYIVAIVGIIFAAIGAFLYFRNAQLAKVCTKDAKATVVDMKQDFSTDEDGSSYTYYPIIEYTVDDKLIRVVMPTGSNTPQYELNEKIDILYNPNKPKEFIVKGDHTSNIFSIVFMVIGVLLTGYGIKVAIKKEN